MPLRVPQVSEQPYRAPVLQAGGVVPFRDFTSQQIQQQGEGMSRLGAVLSRIGEIEQDKLDDTATMHANTATSDALRDIRFRFRSRVGSDAVNARVAAIDEIEQSIKKQRDSLQNDTQRMLFDRQMAEKRSDSLRVIDSHYFEQLDVAEKGAFRGAMAADQQDFVAMWQEPEVDQDGRYVAQDPQKPSAVHDKYFGAAVQRAHDLADKQSLAPDDPQRRAMVLGVTSDMHEALLDNLVQQDPEKAARWFAAKQGEMTPDATARVSSRIATALNLRSATRQRQELEVAAEPVAQSLFRTGVSVNEARMSLAKQRMPQPLADEVLTRLKTMKDDAEKERDRGRETVRQQYEQLFTQDEGLTPDGLAPEIKTRLLWSGLFGEVKNVYRKVRLQRVADYLERDPNAVLRARDIASLRDIFELSQMLDTRVGELTLPEAAKDPRNAIKVAGLKKWMDSLKAEGDELAQKPRVPILPSPTTGPQQGQPFVPLEKRIADELDKALERLKRR